MQHSLEYNGETRIVKKNTKKTLIKHSPDKLASSFSNGKVLIFKKEPLKKVNISDGGLPLIPSLHSKNNLNISSTPKSTKDTINLNNNNNQKNIFSNLSSLNQHSALQPNNPQEEISKPSTGNTISTRSHNQPYDYYSLKKFKKMKSYFQKNMLNESNINKYKTEWLNLISNDNGIQNLLTQAGICKENYCEYLDSHFFKKEHFLFKLEILIIKDIQESNTLKVFSTNKNRLPFNKVKENFFKDEIKRDLKRRIFDKKYQDRINVFMERLNNHISSLKDYEL